MFLIFALQLGGEDGSRSGIADSGALCGGDVILILKEHCHAKIISAMCSNYYGTFGHI